MKRRPSEWQTNRSGWRRQCTRAIFSPRDTRLRSLCRKSTLWARHLSWEDLCWQVNALISLLQRTISWHFRAEPTEFGKNIWHQQKRPIKCNGRILVTEMQLTHSPTNSHRFEWELFPTRVQTASSLTTRCNSHRSKGSNNIKKSTEERSRSTVKTRPSEQRGQLHATTRMTLSFHRCRLASNHLEEVLSWSQTTTYSTQEEAKELPTVRQIQAECVTITEETTRLLLLALKLSNKWYSAT